MADNKQNIIHSSSPARRDATLALLAALALIFSYVENLLPSPGMPGVKLGVANIVIVICLYRYSAAEAACVMASSSPSPM